MVSVVAVESFGSPVNYEVSESALAARPLVPITGTFRISGSALATPYRPPLAILLEPDAHGTDALAVSTMAPPGRRDHQAAAGT